MTDSHTHAEKGTLAVATVLGSIGLLLGGGEPAVAQDRGRTSLSVRSAPSQRGAGSAAQRNGGAPGTELPSATRPADPPSSLGRPPTRSIGSKTRSLMRMPGDPDKE